MNNKVSVIFLLVGMVLMTSCSHYETYAEQKEKETRAIRQYIIDKNINVISEATFTEQGYTTDVSKNEYVLFSASGVYLQIVRKGCGEPIKDGESCTVLCRFTERNIMTDSLLLSNDLIYYSRVVDKLSVRRSSDTFTASFISGESLMYTQYSSASVPAGWLAPLLYINVGRPMNDGDEIAKVNLIVPSSQGTEAASRSVYPCFYSITYEKGR